MTEPPAVLLPDQWGGLTVCDVGQLLDYLADPEYNMTLDDAIDNAAFDSGAGDDLPKLIARVRKLNETGDVAAYWSSSRPSASGMGG